MGSETEKPGRSPGTRPQKRSTKMSGQKRFTRYIGVAFSILGLAVIALGVFFVTAELAAKSEVQAAMAEEQVTVTIDEVKVPVTDQATAIPSNLRSRADFKTS